MLANFGLKNTAILRLRPRKLIFLLFSKIKGFCENNLHQITYLPKSYLYKKKLRKSIFQLLPLDGRYFLTVALNTTVVTIFPNMRLWRRSLCSNLVLTLKLNVSSHLHMSVRPMLLQCGSRFFSTLS